MWIRIIFVTSCKNCYCYHTIVQNLIWMSNIHITSNKNCLIFGTELCHVNFQLSNFYVPISFIHLTKKEKNYFAYWINSFWCRYSFNCAQVHSFFPGDKFWKSIWINNSERLFTWKTLKIRKILNNWPE